MTFGDLVEAYFRKLEGTIHQALLLITKGDKDEESLKNLQEQKKQLTNIKVLLPEVAIKYTDHTNLIKFNLADLPISLGL